MGALKKHASNFVLLLIAIVVFGGQSMVALVLALITLAIVSACDRLCRIKIGKHKLDE